MPHGKQILDEVLHTLEVRIWEPKLWVAGTIQYMYNIHPNLEHLIDLLVQLSPGSSKEQAPLTFPEEYTDCLTLAKEHDHFRFPGRNRSDILRVLRELLPRLIRLKKAFDTPEGRYYLAWWYYRRLLDPDEAVKHFYRGLRADSGNREKFLKVDGIRKNLIGEMGKFLQSFIETSKDARKNMHVC